MKNIFSLFILLSIGLVMLVSCSGDGSNTVSSEKETILSPNVEEGGPPVLAKPGDITSYAFWGTGGTQSFAIHPGLTEITFQPWINGSWWFSAWHTYIFSVGEYAIVWTYWKDASNPNDDWHLWPGGGQAHYNVWLPYPTFINSEQSSISYKFIFMNNNDGSLPVKIKLEKL